jgi:hypothetical protein
MESITLKIPDSDTVLCPIREPCQHLSARSSSTYFRTITVDAPYRCRKSSNLLAATPSHGDEPSDAISAFSDQRRTKSTTRSRTSCGCPVTGLQFPRHF